MIKQGKDKLTRKEFDLNRALIIMIGNFILQVPGSIPRVSTWSEAELMPIKIINGPEMHFTIGNWGTRNKIGFWMG